MRYRLSRHAREEMVRRGLDAGIVDEVMRKPQQMVPASGSNMAYQSQIAFGSKLFLVRVIVDESVDPFVVVTVYRTSKIEKYWEAA